MKRKVKVVVISDVHLGTYGCHARELLYYLNSIQPKILILNGDIVDMWQFRKRYFPKSHMLVIKKILALAAKGTTVYYLTGNHDEKLRKFTGTHMGNLHIMDKLVLKLDNKKAWFFHGDVFDASIKHAKWLAKLGGWGYDLLILMNRGLNWLLQLFGKEKYSLSKRIKNGVKSALKFISNFEDTAAELAIENEYDFVICGHIHQPAIRKVKSKKGRTLYLNSGDWVENLTALEYNNRTWKLFSYKTRERVMELDHSHSEAQTEDFPNPLSAFMRVQD